MLFYTGFILNIVGMVYVTYKTFKTNNIVSPQMIVIFGLFVYLYLPAVVLNSEHIRDNEYNFVLLLGLLGAFWACNRFPYDVIKEKEEQVTNYPIVWIFQLGAYVYIGVLLIQIVLAIKSAGGVGAAFRVNRLDTHLGENLVNTSEIIEYIKEGLKILFYYYFAYLVAKKKTLWAVALFIVPMVHHRFTAVTRYDFIAMAGALGVYFLNQRFYCTRSKDVGDRDTTKKRKLRLGKLIIFGAVGLYLALVFMRVSNYTRFGVSAESMEFSFIKLVRTTLLNDSLYYEYFHTLFAALKNNIIEFEYGLSWLVYPFVNIVPRSIWPAKPYTAFSARMTDEVYWSLTSGNPVVTFSILGEGYAQFGLVGVFICSYVFLKSRWINFSELKKMKYNEMYLLILMFSMVTYMRSEAPIFYVVLDGLWLWIIRMTCTYVNKGEAV